MPASKWLRPFATNADGMRTSAHWHSSQSFSRFLRGLLCTKKTPSFNNQDNNTFGVHDTVDGTGGDSLYTSHRKNKTFSCLFSLFTRRRRSSAAKDIHEIDKVFPSPECPGGHENEEEALAYCQ